MLSIFIQDYIYRKQFFKVYDFDGFSMLANQRPEDFIVYTENNKLPLAANACGTMYNISKQSSFKTPNDYPLEISQPFFTLSDGPASIGNMITMFDSFSRAHNLLSVPEWAPEDVWSKFIDDDSNSTKWSKRWGGIIGSTSISNTTVKTTSLPKRLRKSSITHSISKVVSSR